MKKVVVHNDRFHADDVFAVAVLDLVFKGGIEVTRTRDDEIIKTADIVIDVGGEYCPETNRFDHHQTEGAGERGNGIPYASFGLIWKHFGESLCSNQKAWDKFDSKLVQAIDASDNGFAMYEYKDEDFNEYHPDAMIGAFNPSWTESADLYDKNFFVAVGIAKQIIEREIKMADDKIKGEEFVKEVYEKSDDKKIIVFDEMYPFKSFIKEKKEVLFVVSPSKLRDSWRVLAVQEQGFKNRKDLPKEWSGLRDKELQKISGIDDAKFCHRSLFMGAASSKEGAIKMAQIAVDN
jgi:uncharacterized UPF0160 family protein